MKLITYSTLFIICITIYVALNSEKTVPSQRIIAKSNQAQINKQKPLNDSTIIKTRSQPPTPSLTLDAPTLSTKGDHLKNDTLLLPSADFLALNVGDSIELNIPQGSGSYLLEVNTVHAEEGMKSLSGHVLGGDGRHDIFFFTASPNYLHGEVTDHNGTFIISGNGQTATVISYLDAVRGVLPDPLTSLENQSHSKTSRCTYSHCVEKEKESVDQSILHNLEKEISK